MPQQIIASSAAVASGHPYGTLAGIEMLRGGGNAIDAAVSAMIALSVVIPGSVGLGGYGGSAVVYRCGRSPDGAAPETEGFTAGWASDRPSEPVQGRETRAQQGVFAVDFDSRAPLGFKEGLVTADPESNHYGARSVTVPAVVAGLDLILRKFGTKSWREVSQSAIRLAEEGFECDAEHRRYLDRCAPKFDRQSLESLFPDGALPRVGDRWRQPDLARLLGRLADDGPASFYEGEIAQQIVRFLAGRGGILTDEDFRAYRPQIVEPVQTEFRSRLLERRFQLYTPPPPSGGITSLGIVATFERFDANDMVPWSGPYFHILAEATKICWHERHSTLGDPDFVSAPLDQLTSHVAAEARAQEIRAGRNSRAHASTNGSGHTANVIAADAEGNLISLTATQGWMYGSHLVVGGLGLVLNHGMSRFDYSPGHPNLPAPGKRMQHNMSPMIALCEGRPAFAYGLPGGPKIVNVTAQLALGTLAFGATPAESIAAPRLHTVGDEPLQMSTHTPDTVVAELEKFGHTICREEDMGGPVNVLAIDPTGQLDIASGEATGAVAGI